MCCVSGGGEAIRLEENAIVEKECSSVLNTALALLFARQRQHRLAEPPLLTLSPTWVTSAPLQGLCL